MNSAYRILIVDHSQSDLVLLKDYFKLRANFQPALTRVDTKEGFKAALSSPWDAILSEFNIPGFSAVEALAMIKDMNLSIPLIVVSGAISEEDAVEIMHAGADDFIRKDKLARLVPALERSIRVNDLKKQKTKLAVSHEKALQDRERLMDVVCHDIKNPLSSVRLACQLLIQKAKESVNLESSLVSEITEGILRSSERVNGLVRDLLEQSRIETGLFGIRSKKVSILDFLAETVDSFASIASEKKVTIKVEPLGQSVDVFFDRDRISQVMGNLLSNALKFSPANSSILIGVSNSESRIKFTISDSGPGISASDSQMLFSKFFQGKANRVKGHGLGLWIAQEIVRAHGGEIGFFNSPNSLGTTFWFSLPTQLDKVVNAENSPSDGLAPRVLIVDDDEDLTITICKILTEKKVKCQIASCYGDAVDLLVHGNWQKTDLLLVDYDLPGKSGGELVKWVRQNIEKGTRPRMVLMSAHPDIDERAKSLDVKQYLRKPMDLEEILDLLITEEG